jgi:hypothetical protein
LSCYMMWSFEAVIFSGEIIVGSSECEDFFWALFFLIELVL